MAVDDYVDREVGVIAAATAAAVSPRARELFRRGAVYGLAGVLRAGDVTLAAARGAARGAKDGAAKTSAPRSATASRSRPRKAATSRQRKRSSRTAAARSRPRASAGTRNA